MTKTLVGALLVALGCSLILAVGVHAEGLDEQLVKKAWEANVAGKYSEAIEAATECIEKFEDRAFQIQAQLEGGKTPLPPVGKVTKEKKEEIFRLGLINSVGAALFVVADSERKAGNKDQARAAYQKLEKLTYARIYDPSWDGFWAPAEEASSILKKL